MGKSRILTGSPWHIEKYTRQEDDPRRHRSRCVNYNATTKHCSYRCEQCTGSAHCSHYQEKQEPAFIPDEPIKPKKSKMEFEGIKDIPMKQVEIGLSKAKQPSKDKVDNLIAYYKKNGKLDKPIVVSVHKDKYRLVDKYLRYYVAKQLELETIPAKIGTYKESKVEDKIRKIGTKIDHKKFGTGVVVEADATYVSVRFDNGKIMKFNISFCLEKGLLAFK